MWAYDVKHVWGTSRQFFSFLSLMWWLNWDLKGNKPSVTSRDMSVVPRRFNMSNSSNEDFLNIITILLVIYSRILTPLSACELLSWVALRPSGACGERTRPSWYTACLYKHSNKDLAVWMNHAVKRLFIIGAISLPAGTILHGRTSTLRPPRCFKQPAVRIRNTTQDLISVLLSKPLKDIVQPI